MFFVIFLIILIVAYLWVKANYLSPEAKYAAKLSKGKNPEQKKLIRYLVMTKSIFVNLISDAEYIDIVSQLLNSKDIKSKALASVGVDEEQVKEVDPVVLSGFEYGRDSIAKRTDNNGMVTSIVQRTYIFFSQDQVYGYTFYYDVVKDTNKTKTLEYFYQDITSVSSTEEEVKNNVIIDGIQKEEYSNVSQFQIIVPGDKYTVSIDGFGDDSAEERYIMGMKQLIRDKKSAMINK